VTKLNPDGAGLVYSTYLGGVADDGAFGIAVDAGGNAYVTGVTASSDFPTTAGAFTNGYVFVTKLNPAGAGLVYSTHFGGGNGSQEGHGIAVDASGNAYVTGFTYPFFTTTAGAVQPTSGGNSDAFVAKIAAGLSSDATPPQVSCGTADSAWHNGDVTIACTASDPESGLADPADASFNLTTNVAIGTETANAATNSRQVCNTVGGCTTAGPISGNKVDKKPPTITIASPTANAMYQLNASAGASYACGDGGSGVASCQGPVANGSPINTSSTGTKMFTVTSTDTVSNPSTFTATYSVVAGGGGGSTSADVGITLSAPAKVSLGGTLTYSITVTNGGKATATGVVVSDALPAGTVFASASASQGTVASPSVGTNGTVTVNLGSLANGATAPVSIVVTVTARSGTLTDTANVTATTQDLNSKNNSATQTTKVQ